MSTKPPLRPSLFALRAPAGLWRRDFARRREGLTALEFAIVAPVAIAALFWIFEFSFIMIRQQAVDFAAAEAARLIRTGRAQNSPNPETTVRNGMCAAAASTWFDCTDLALDVRTFNSFKDINPPDPIYKDGEVTNFMFNPGGAGSVMMVRVLYTHSVVTPIMASIFKEPLPLIAGVVVQAEPWE